MIPEWKDLRKKTKKLKIPDDQYFAVAEEYTQLKDKLYCDSFIETLYLWFDMLIHPIYIVVQLCMQKFSPSHVLTLVRTYQLWVDWFRYRELDAKIESWKTTVRSLGGPWISSNNPDLHVFVYADGMERIRYAKQKAYLPSRKTEKMSPKVELPAQSQASSPLKSPSVPSAAPSAP